MGTSKIDIALHDKIDQAVDLFFCNFRPEDIDWLKEYWHGHFYSKLKGYQVENAQMISLGNWRQLMIECRGHEIRQLIIKRAIDRFGKEVGI